MLAGANGCVEAHPRALCPVVGCVVHEGPSEHLAIVAIIPARFASTRLPGKPLSRYPRQADDPAASTSARGARNGPTGCWWRPTTTRIADAVRAFGGEAVLTSPRHRSGTDRLAEAARSTDAEVVVNVQGDEPLLDPLGHRRGRSRSRATRLEIATLSVPLVRREEMLAPSVVKVVATPRATRSTSRAAPSPTCARPATATPRAAAAAAVARGLARKHVGPLRLSARGAAALRGAAPRAAGAGRGPRAAARAAARHADPGRARRRRGGRRRSTRRRTSSACARCWRRGREGQRERACHQVHLRDGRRGLVPRQGPGVGVDRAPARGPRLPGRADEVRPVHQRRPRHHEPLPARRGLRHRRRRRDRPRPRALRALHALRHLEGLEHHHRQGLRLGHRAGAARRLPRPHRAGDPAHHRRDQGRDPRARGAAGRRRGDRRDRRHRRRHRGPALPRGGAPVPPRRRAARTRSSST